MTPAEPIGRPLRVVHVVAVLDEGGIGVTVPRLCRALSEHGLRVTLATLARGQGSAVEVPGVEVVRFRPSPPATPCFSWEMRRRIGSLVRQADLVHVHSNWTYPVWCAGGAARRLGKPLAMTPHGCLLPERLRLSPWRKRLASALFDRRLLRAADLLHATSASEAESFRAYGLARPAAVIPWGVDAPPPAAATPRDPAAPRRALSLGRIHAMKGLADLVAAWAKAARAATSRWQLTIAGPDEDGYGAHLARLAAAQGLRVCRPDGAGALPDEADIRFAGAVHGTAKWDLYRSSDLFVLPSHSENFGLVVAEALACSVPVIATQATPWSELEGAAGDFGRCGWWVQGGTEPLATALREAMRLLNEERRRFGENGRQLVTRNYGWPAAAARMYAAYADVLGGRHNSQAATASPFRNHLGSSAG
jgi:glycosyltransferase involved in cell wall biosynthesis